jgi:GrpB-like predicted nucleotidyltransferase (UPF0157 family)
VEASDGEAIIYCLLQPAHAGARGGLQRHFAKRDPRVTVIVDKRAEAARVHCVDRRRMAIPRSLPALPNGLARKAGPVRYTQHALTVGTGSRNQSADEIAVAVRLRVRGAATELYWRVYERLHSRLTLLLGDTGEVDGALVLAFGRVLDALEFGPPSRPFELLLYEEIDTAAASVIDGRASVELPDGGLAIQDPALDEPVRVAAADPFVETRARTERGRLLRLLGSEVRAIEHVGATAVQDAGGRPIIDLLIGVDGPPETVVDDLVDAGYSDCGNAGVDGRRYLRDRRPGSHVDLHVVECGGPLWEDALALRAHLRRNPSEADRWTETKAAAARIAPMSSQRYFDLRRLVLETLLEDARVGPLALS